MAFLASLLWLVAMLAAVVHAARPVGRGYDLLWLAAAFGAALALGQLSGAANGIAGVAVGVTAAWRLAAGPAPRRDLAFAGLCAGLAASVHMASSVDVWTAAAIALAIVGFALFLARSPRFGSPRMHEAVLMLAAFAGPIIAAAPEIAAGWTSAQALTQTGEAAAGRIIPFWALAFVTAALLVGGVRGYWIRK